MQYPFCHHMKCISDLQRIQLTAAQLASILENRKIDCKIQKWSLRIKQTQYNSHFLGNNKNVAYMTTIIYYIFFAKNYIHNVLIKWPNDFLPEYNLVEQIYVRAQILALCFQFEVTYQASSVVLILSLLLFGYLFIVKSHV